MGRRFADRAGTAEAAPYDHTRRGRRRAPLQRCRRVAAFAICVALTACGGKHEAEEEPHAAEVPTITADTAKVTRQSIVDDLAIRGTITAIPNEDVKVSALVAGRVNAVTVAEGDTVREGQVIAELDRQPLVDQRRQAAAAVEDARAKVENARANQQRNQQLFERGIASGKEVEDAKAQMAESQSALEQATAALNTADRNVSRAEIRSPIAGQVVKRMVSVGEQVDGTAAQPIAQIANTDRVELAANVPAEHLRRIKVGQAATLTTDAPAGSGVTGTVLAIAPAVDTATNAGLVRVRIANPGHALKVGMFAEAHVVLDRHDGLVVPPPALVKNTDGAVVYIVTGDLAQRTAVKVGMETPDAVEILEGVSEGQIVLTSSVYGLGDKAKLAKPEEKKPDKGDAADKADAAKKPEKP